MLLIMDSAMKITLLLSLFAVGILSTTPARAGAASGMPNPFFPPYPDYGCDARCIMRHEAALHCRIAGGARLTRHGAAWCRTAD